MQLILPEISVHDCSPTLLGMATRCGLLETITSGIILARRLQLLLTACRVPMIAPFFGCTFGGWLYDFLIYPGESPVNTPWVGLKRIVRPDWKAVKAELTGKDPNQV
jgi:hypothetical protein